MINIRIIKNPKVLFTLNRYVAYTLQFIAGILIAKILGPYYLGIWGFVSLMRQYLSFTNFGVDHAVNIELSTKDKTETERIQNLIGNSIILTLILAAVIIISGVAVNASGFNLFDKYDFNHYLIFVVLIAAITHVNQVLMNIYRSYGYLFRMMVVELIPVVLMILCIIYFDQNELIMALLYALIISGVISAVIYIIKFPFPFRLQFNFYVSKSFLSLGTQLLIYNVSFHLILVACRTIISCFYSVEEMGYFSLAHSITMATLLGLQAMIFVLLPEMLWKFREDVPVNVVRDKLEKFNRIYIPVVYLVVFGMIMVSPLLFVFLDKYKPLAPALNYLLIAQAIISARFAYDALAMSRKQQNKVTIINIKSVGIVIVLGIITAFLKLNFTFIAFAAVISLTYCSYSIVKLSEGILGASKNFSRIIRILLPRNYSIPLVIVICGNVFGYYQYAGIAGFVILAILNYKRVYQSTRYLNVLALPDGS